MSILIKGLNIPTPPDELRLIIRPNGQVIICHRTKWDETEAIELPAQHGRLIDADALRTAMYHEAFETDTPMQKWDSGCWIRYKMFERAEESAPTIIEAEGAKG